MGKKKFLTDYYVDPHTKISREVEEQDLERIKKDGKIMHKLCFEPVGIYSGGLAIAHPQINEQDPLRFFVTAEGQYIINPKILNHTRHTVDSVEGCLSFPFKKQTIVKRYNVMDVKYQTLEGNGKLSGYQEETVNGKRAKMFQHEIDHFDGKYIFSE